MKDTIVDLVGPEGFEWVLLLLGVGLPVLMVLVCVNTMLIPSWSSAGEGEDDEASSTLGSSGGGGE